MTKGEIFHHEQFLLLSQCFQNSSALDASECVCRWEKVKINSSLIRGSEQLFSPQYFPYYSIKSYVVGTQKNCLTQMILLSTHNIVFECKIMIFEHEKCPFSSSVCGVLILNNSNPFSPTSNLQQNTLKLWQIFIRESFNIKRSWKHCGKRRKFSFF